ncbi:MAG: molybdopterin molybdotransferase MoeA [Kiloniellales bacterium]|nr:molybdopterin molybdotransferase MoeA [Kiloniellales bacterium]
MVQLSDDCFAHGGELMATRDALDLLSERLDRVTETEQIQTGKALGRVLSADVVARTSMPPHDNAAVDGYAVRFTDLNGEGETSLPVAARIAAGQAVPQDITGKCALRIFTGAIVPDGFDTIFMQEDVRLDGGRVILPTGIKSGSNRRKAGEDFFEGDTLLRAGHRLRPQDLGLAAAGGHERVPVSKPLRVALFSTGDELLEPGVRLPEGAIHDSNRYTLMGLLATLKGEVTDLGILPDNKLKVQDALDRAAETHDMIITSGGVSVGEEDHVKAAVEALGRLHVWRLAIKPGRPLALGQVRHVPFIGLPGNPVAVMVTFLLIARPAMLRLMGASELEPRRYKLPAAFDFKKKGKRREWLRVHLVSKNGRLEVELFRRQGSGILSSLVAADGLVELEEDLTELRRGAMVDFLPFSEVL